jgi:orotate phosphoribosyltransferase
MNRQELARQILQVAHLTGNFKLRSGQTSNEYFDKYRFESRPDLLRAIADQIAEILPAEIDAFAALEMGGIPIATALSLKTGIPVVFVRKEAKDYGTCRFAEGLDVKGKKLLVVEDVITTGGQVVISTEDLRELGARIEEVVCVIDRSQGKTEKITGAGLKLQALFTMAELKAQA